MGMGRGSRDGGFLVCSYDIEEEEGDDESWDSMEEDKGMRVGPLLTRVDWVTDYKSTYTRPSFGHRRLAAQERVCLLACLLVCPF